MKLAGLIAYLLVNLIHILASGSIPTTNYDHYLLSCGEVSSNQPSFDGRTWHTDNNNTFSHSFSSTTAVATVVAGATLSQVPFSTARVFTANFTYSFPVSPGPKFIRLFFNPSFATASLSAKDAYLTVQSNYDHLLLRNFSVYLSQYASSQQNPAGFIEKEFYVHIASSILQLTFSPTRTGSYAFVNGIEVVSVPKNLYEGTSLVDLTSPGFQLSLQNTDALENAYRLNVGGGEINRNNDSGSIYRRWLRDDDYLIDDYHGTETTGYNRVASLISYTTNYSAPPEVYQTFRSMGDTPENIKSMVNVTWEFEVDLGFEYLLRLHWCEVVVDINSSNYRVFTVYIGGLVAEEQMDVFQRVGQNSAFYRDYLLYMGMGDAGSPTRGNLQIAMHPYFGSHTKYRDVLLNGLEIFKKSKSDGGLNAANPADPTLIDQAPSPQNSISHSHSIFPVIIGVVAGAILLVVLFCFLIFRKRNYSKTSSGASGTTSSKSKYFFSSGKSGTANKSGGGSSYLPSHLCRHFTLMDIRHATSDFSDTLIVGHGGFGNVYKGTVDTEAGPTLVAIKRLKALSTQGAREFAMEIQLLSKLRHVNLVSLIGYCDDAGEMILVYEYMSHGTLKDHLYPNNTQLSWRERLEVCVGAARGLNYLHTGTDRMVIHRDVKSANILLDEAWMAKVADFGLSKLGPTGDDLSHVSTAVKGSFGYVDPEYYRRQQLTEKSDVYSFGVVLFEVLCGRAAVNPNLPKEQVNLRMWARRNQLSGTLDAIVDPKLVGQIAPESLRKFGEVAESCVRDEGTQRPSMADVIGGLELALKLQMEDTVSTGLVCPGDDKGSKYPGYTSLSITSPTTDESDRLIRNMNSGESTWTSMNNSTSGLFSSSASQGYGGSGPVFSEIFKPEGR